MKNMHENTSFCNNWMSTYYNGSIDTSILDIGLNSSPVHTYKLEINTVFIFIDIKIKTDES